MKYVYVASAVMMATVGPANAYAVVEHQGATRAVENGHVVQEAKWRWPKIHKCELIRRGISCEIKVSQLMPSAESYMQEALLRAQAERMRQEKAAEDARRKAEQDASRRAAEEAKRKATEDARRAEEARRKATPPTNPTPSKK